MGPGPRRMDSFGRSAGAVPQRPRPEAPVQPRMAPQPRPVQRPMARPAMTQGYDRGGYEQQPVGRGQAMARPAQERAPRPARKSKGWQVVLQFVVGLVVIVGVAAAIVALYIKYYK
jgi:hypothetical protein